MRQAPGSGVLDPMVRLLVRLGAYCAGTMFICLLAFAAGTAHFDSTCDEDDPEVNECDLGAVEGFMWSTVAFLGCGVVAGVNEAVLSDRRARDRRRRSASAVRP